MRAARRRVIVMALGILAGCRTTAPTGYDSAAETLFNAPHRTVGSLSAMPRIEPVERPFARDWENISTYPGSAAILDALERELPCIRANCSPTS